MIPEDLPKTWPQIQMVLDEAAEVIEGMPNFDEIPLREMGRCLVELGERWIRLSALERPYGSWWCKKHSTYHPRTIVWWRADKRKKSGLGFHCAARPDGSENVKRRQFLKQIVEVEAPTNPLTTIDFTLLLKRFKRRFKVAFIQETATHTFQIARPFVPSNKLAAVQRKAPVPKFAASRTEAERMMVVSVVECCLRSALAYEPEENWSYVSGLSDETLYQAVLLIDQAVEGATRGNCGILLYNDLGLRSTADRLEVGPNG